MLSALRSPLSALRSPLSALRSPLGGRIRYERPLRPAPARARSAAPVFLYAFVFGLTLCVPSLTLAQLTATLEIPDDGDTLSGIGVISGWKCEAEGDITVRLDGGIPIKMVYGSERGDTRRPCGDADNGFLAIFNWSLLLDGEHTAVAYDNGVEFARSTFEVATLGEEFLTDADVRVRVPNFPAPGETTWFRWVEGTQHLEIDRTISLEDVCGLIPDRQAPESSIDAPLLGPPPLPCPRDRRGDFNGDGYYMQFHHDQVFTDRTCNAARGTMQVRVAEGRIAANLRVPPHGRLRVSGEVCEDNGFYLGSWTQDGNFAGVFFGGLTPDQDCPGLWQDTSGCWGSVEIFEIPRQ